MRKKLVNAIIKLAGDELNEATLLNMCVETDEQLVDRLISIANWYATYYNELDEYNK